MFENHFILMKISGIVGGTSKKGWKNVEKNF